MQIQNNYKLINLNTFGINAVTKFFVEIKSEKDLTELFNSVEFKNNKKIFLGGGSNILFTGDFDGMVVLNKLKGINIVEDNPETVLIKSMGGEIWNDLVNYVVNKGYWGIENLALIPGTTGAAPMQNIGAYGTELKDTLFSVEAFEIETGEKKIFNKEECELGYRESIFKNKLKGKYFIGAVTLKLSKILKPNISYKILSDYLEKNNININISRNISDAVAEIRKSKLPDPKIIGNAGSFFKNVLITKAELERLQKNYPEIPYFKEQDTTSPPAPLLVKERGEIQYKIPAGWLIEQCEWKGKRIGNVGVHDKQALVLVNHGGATGAEIIELANKIMVSVKEKFGLDLVPEVNIV
jgi:UDP-N-acetylmuramate dehydrogenase